MTALHDSTSLPGPNRVGGVRQVNASMGIWEFLLLLTPFMSGLYRPTQVGNIYLQYALFAMYLVFGGLRFRKLEVPGFFRIGLFLIILSSLFGSILLGTPIEYLVSYVPPLSLTFLAYFRLLKSNGFDSEALLAKYYSVTVVICLFAVAQQVAYLGGSDQLLFTADIVKSNGPFVGVVGLSSEPSNFAVALAPAVFLAIRSMLIGRQISAGSLLIVGTTVMTLSALGGVAIVLSLLVLAPSAFSRRAFVFLLASPALVYAVLTLASQRHFETRLNDTVEVVLYGAELTPGEINLSTYSWVVNSQIVRRALPENGLMGVGIGAYPEVYDKYIDEFETPIWRDSLPGRGTATSLFLKIVAEFGLVGGIAALWFLFRTFSRSSDNYVNHALFVTLVLIYVRMGFYYINGVPLFVLLYMYSSRRHARGFNRRNVAGAGSKVASTPLKGGLATW